MRFDNKNGEPTPERLAKAGNAIETFTPDRSVNFKALRMLDGSVLDLLAGRGVISGDQYTAGAQFYEDWYYSGLACSGVVDPGRVQVDCGGSSWESDVRLDAATRWRKAVQHIGPVHGYVATCLVLNGETLESLGQRRYGYKDLKNARLAATTALKDALTSLDLHYHGTRRGGTRQSHRQDYRPYIMGGS